jgi:hypothetical protein
MYSIKVVSDREAVYQFASYVRSVQGVKDVYVEVGEALYERPHTKFFIHFSIHEYYDTDKVLCEIACLVELGRFTYVHYRDEAIERAFASVKYESYS